MHLSQRVFREFFARVSTAIQGSLDQLAGELLGKNLIDWDVMNEMSGTLGLSLIQTSQKLLCIVQNKIGSENSDKPFKSLCHVMENFPVLEDLAKEMTEKFGKHFVC